MYNLDQFTHKQIKVHITYYNLSHSIKCKLVYFSILDCLCSAIDQHTLLKPPVHGYTSDELSYSYQPHQHCGSVYIDTNHERKYVKVNKEEI
jgi:hypothetical protein